VIPFTIRISAGATQIILKDLPFWTAGEIRYDAWLAMSRNLIFISHCDFRGNSSVQLFSIANVLADLGHSCAVCVPNQPETAFDLGRPRFQALSYEEAVLHGVSFANDHPPDLVHAWTPREKVRKTAMALVQRYKVPYLVHLEDNEIAVLLDELPGWSLENLERLPSCALDLMVRDDRIHPHRWREMLAGAAGVTVLIDRLLEFKPANVPGMVFFPGYKAEFEKIEAREEGFRAALGIAPDELLVVYTGNVHNSNFKEVRSLVLAIALLNRRGIRAKLIKAGSNFYSMLELCDPNITQHLIELGLVPHSEVPRLLAAADVLVQPGPSNEFNDFRFPSKLPEFLASGRPVILPRSNVGLLLKDGEQALVLGQGHSADIADALKRLATDPQLRARIGQGGRAFALHNLNWKKNVAAFPAFYDRCLSEERPSTGPCKAEEPAVPKVIAFYLPQFHLTRRNALYGKESTPWTNAVAERTNYPSFVKPESPGHNGPNNLEAPETMETEVALARRFKVFGFCFYYYWFNGRRFLARPLTQFLERTQLNFPFCVCWANENWSRYWCGQEREALIEQEYRDDFSVKFIRDIIPILKDPRYIKVHGDPVLMVYRVSLFPDPPATAEIWRAECRKTGIPSLHLVAVQSLGIGDPRPFGFDAAVEFPPYTRQILMDRRSPADISRTFQRSPGDYPNAVIHHLSKHLPDYTLYPGVTPARDAAPRPNPRAEIPVQSSAKAYQARLRRVTAQAMALADAQAPLIFVNSWNDRAEGAILEPDAQRGNRFLEATRTGLNEGLADYLRVQGVRIDQAAVPNLLVADDQDAMGSEPLQNQDRPSAG
jgi:glycosyltransferase involved in cell wall biosynthesis